nr:unnamed protein product [Callosobruchus analis]
MVDHNNNTGGGRRSYTYEKEIEDVFGKKRNVHPELLLDASAIHMPITLQRKETCIEGNVLGITEKEAWRQVCRKVRMLGEVSLIVSILTHQKLHLEE